MSVQTIDPLPKSECRTQAIQIRRMELFILPLHEKQSLRNQVVLLLTTNAGQVCSDITLELWQETADWVTWSTCFTRILNTKEPHSENWFMQQYQENSLQRVLLCSAFEQVSSNTGIYRNCLEMKSKLFDRASCYISLF